MVLKCVRNLKLHMPENNIFFLFLLSDNDNEKYIMFEWAFIWECMSVVLIWKYVEWCEKKIIMFYIIWASHSCSLLQDWIEIYSYLAWWANEVRYWKFNLVEWIILNRKFPLAWWLNEVRPEQVSFQNNPKNHLEPLWP